VPWDVSNARGIKKKNILHAAEVFDEISGSM
jgi:hypothetical protein